MRPEFRIHKIRITEVFLTLRYMGKLLGPEVLAGLDKNPEYTRSGVHRLYCTYISATPPFLHLNKYINKRPKGPHILHLSTIFMCHLFDRSAR